jgi:hypothetical protein
MGYLTGDKESHITKRLFFFLLRLHIANANFVVYNCKLTQAKTEVNHALNGFYNKIWLFELTWEQ